ncbi:GntR family transcriptional regulator [Streptomyces sp. NPDC006530]|uniref:GntR family transcriptional regulator n=1 Tax=Streptomyces sp. NPDC006530 TaxID=3364750 RepID=UPI003674D627
MGADEWVSTSLPYLAPHGRAPSDAWGAEAAARGGKGRQRIVHAGEVPAPAEVAGALGGAEGMPVVVRRRVMYLDDLPCELTDSYYPLKLARGTGLARTAKIPGGAVRLLAELGHTGVRVREDVFAELPDDEAQEILRLGPTEPVLRLTRTTLDADDRPIQVDRMTMPARLQRLRYEIRIG